MPIFGGTNPFDADVEKITNPKNTSEDWGIIIDLCDKVKAVTTGPKDCLKAIIKRLNHQDPHVVLQAITLLDACVNNCGKPFLLEVASSAFETEFRKLFSKSHPKIKEKLKSVLKKWVEGEFKSDPALSLIPSLYSSLKKEGIDFSSTSDQRNRGEALPKDPNVVASQQEEDDIARAIQLSLQESKSTPAKSLYPTTVGRETTQTETVPKKEEKKARALYDFEAAEDNELTFKAGEIVIVTDNSDVNWWKGSNHRGEGLFPANFVTLDLEASSDKPSEDKQRRRSVQFNEEVEVKTVSADASSLGISGQEEEVEISEEKIDHVLHLLHEADPTSPEHDPPDLHRSEEAVLQMGPLIDAELERVDRRHAQLTRLSTELVEALNLYHQLMHEMPVFNNPAPSMQPAYGVPQSYMQGMPPTQQGPYPQPSYVPTYNGYLGPDPNIYGSAPPPPTPPLQGDIHQQIPVGGSSYPSGNPPPVGVYPSPQYQ